MGSFWHAHRRANVSHAGKWARGRNSIRYRLPGSFPCHLGRRQNVRKFGLVLRGIRAPALGTSCFGQNPHFLCFLFFTRSILWGQPPARETLGIPTLAVRDAQAPHFVEALAAYKVKHIAAHESVVVAVVDGSSRSTHLCRACGDRNGTLVKCDSCPMAFHPTCLSDGGAQFLTREEGALWTCPRCLAFRGEGARPPAEESGSFKSLIDLIDFMYPEVFSPSPRLTLAGDETQVGFLICHVIMKIAYHLTSWLGH